MERASNLRNKINHNTIDNIRDFVSNYDKEIDSLIIQRRVPMHAVSVDWDGDFWVRVNPDSGEIVGVEIEDYKGFFSKKYHCVLKGITVSSPILKEVVIALLKSGSKPYTKKEFTTDLKRVCQRVTV